MLFVPERDQLWRKPAAGQRRELVNPGMARRTEGRKPAGVMLSGPTVVDVRPRWEDPADHA